MTTDAPAPSPLPTAATEPTPRRVLPVLIAPIVGLIVANNIGNGGAAAMVEDRPLLLVSLTNLLRWQVATVPETVWWTWAAVCFARLLVADPFFYLLGRFYGDTALAAVSRNVPSIGRTIATIERYFHRSRLPVVFVAPNNTVCLLAGADRMNVARFAAANLAGTVTRLLIVRLAAPFVEDQIKAFNRFMGDYKWWFVGVSVAVLALGSFGGRGKGSGGFRKVSQDLGG
jgi:hypothetical protein